MIRKLAVLLAAAAACGPVPAAGVSWSAPPDAAAGLLLFTGSDLGHVVPRGCHRGRGGGLYRPPLARHLVRTRPDLESAWLSTGNFAPVEGDPEAVGAVRDIFALYAMTGYAAVGLGGHDLDSVTAWTLHALSELFGVPIVASNVIVRETGRPAFEPSLVIEVGGTRVGVVSLLEHRPDRAYGDALSGTLVTIEPEAGLRQALAALEGRADVVVLLSTLRSSTVGLLGDALEGVDFVASGWSAYVRNEPERGGPTRVLWLGNDGLHLGRIALGAAGAPLSPEIVEVSPPFPVDPLTGRPAAGAGALPADP